jgi:iron complex transport system permease protein
MSSVPLKRRPRIYTISSRAGDISMLTLLLIGIAANSFLSALVALNKLISSEALHGIVFWILGSLQVSGWNHFLIASPLILIGICVIYFYARDLNVISLGESQVNILG